MAERNINIELTQSSTSKKAYIYIVQDELKISILNVVFYKQYNNDMGGYDIYAKIKYVAGDKTPDTVSLNVDGNILAKPANYVIAPLSINTRLNDGVEVKKILYRGVNILQEAVMDVKSVSITTINEPIEDLKDDILGFEVGEHPVQLSVM